MNNRINLTEQEYEQELIDQCNSLSEIEDDGNLYVNFVSRNNRNRNNNRPFTGKFKGTCNAYRTFGHHAKNCIFLRKLRKCLDYIRNQPHKIQEIKENH